ncbi:T3SS effector HopA1 family protein [Streptomyces nojiriensis]|uniref:T3SS effector HopA1 family protein n=1 Tax=Streptomyces nojiriensis TaxID=66374 RepID=UPI00368686F1
MSHGMLDRRVVHVAENIELSPTLRQARVGPRHVTADDERALRRKVWRTVYEVFHAGLELREADGGGAASGQDGPHPELVAEYSRRVPHGTSRASGTVIERTQEWTVGDLNGVRVRFPTERTSASEHGGGTAVFEVGSRRPALSPGFFAVTGSAGSLRRGPVLRVYVNAGSPRSAVAVWEAALQCLEGRRARYQAKAVSRPGSVTRRDSVVVYLDATSLSLLPELTSAISQQGPAPSVPFFAHELAPGIAVAWEPRTMASAAVSFGQHRAEVITDAVFEFRRAPEGRFERTAREHLKRAFIDPENISRNVDSPRLDLPNTTF